MEPHIQYAKTKDGVSIAFWVMGEGRPLVATWPAAFSNIRAEWQSPEWRRWYESLAEKRRLVRYDRRGAGLSDREDVDLSLDAQLLDLEAVVDRLALQRFALFAVNVGGPVAVTYAARHPERISHIVFWCSFARMSDFMQSPRMQALVALIDSDWELYTETMSHVLFGFSEGEQARRFAAVMRESVTPESLRAMTRATGGIDVTDVLAQVKSPALVLHRRGLTIPDVGAARTLAAGIPDARLAVLEGAGGAPWQGDPQAVLDAIDEFLGEGAEAEAAAELPEGMAVLLFADIAESTALTEQLGDAAFRAKARELDTSLRSVIRESGGTPVEGKVLGDGVLAVFTSARQAIDCALRCEAAGEPLGLQLHLGIHAGDVIREGNNVYGGAVNIAARIAAAAQPGEVLVSDTVRSLGRTSTDVNFDDRGEHTLKGVGEPQRLFAVRGGG
jgi:class 3 adenylate cyclase